MFTSAESRYHMRSVKPMKAAKISYIIISALLCVSGVVMMAVPELSVTVVGTVLGIAMIVFGIVKLAAYFSKDLFRLAFQYDLAFGILLIALGVLVLLQPDGAMSFFCIVLGICVLTDGLFKIQIAIDAKRFGITKWWIVMVMAILTVAMGIVLVLRPGESAAVIMLLAGIGIFVEGLLNICVSLCMVKIVKNQYPDVIEGDYEVEE